jgi:putative endonuclease
VGKRGEDLACEYLINQGFKIVDRNYWKPWGEIDVVAQKGTDLRFVEVKTVTREALPKRGLDYEPEDNLHPWKRQRLRRIIETYILQKDIPDEIDWQVDAISVYVNPRGELLKIEVLEDMII